MKGIRDVERHETLVIGGGQAGLSVGYHLARRGLSFQILDAERRTGDTWRRRWDSLRLFTPARFNGLDGMPFPAPPHYYPTKDEMADYLVAYAAHFDLPVQSGVRVDRVVQEDGDFVVSAADRRFRAHNVVVAMASYQRPRIPAFAKKLAPGITQLHSHGYRNPSQLREGPVLLVGAGNSAAELAVELSARHEIWMSGRRTGQIPFRIDGFFGRKVGVRAVLRGLFHRIFTVRTPIGRKVRPKVLHSGGPLIRQKERDLVRAGVRRVPRTADVRQGLPVLDDGRVLEPANVIWCTGFDPSFEWIDGLAQGDGEPAHRSGVVDLQPGLFFVGLHFLHAFSSTMVHGVGRDAERIARAVEARQRRVEPPVTATRASPAPLLPLISTAAIIPDERGPAENDRGHL